MKKFMVGKRLLSLLTVVCMLVACAPTVFAAAPSNMIIGDPEPAWTGAATIDSAEETIDGNSYTVHKVSINNIWAGTSMKTTEFNPGNKIKVDFWAKIDDSVETDSAVLRVFNNENQTDSSLFGYVTVTKSWQHFTTEFTAFSSDGAAKCSTVTIAGHTDETVGEGLKDHSFYIHSCKAVLAESTDTTTVSSSTPANNAVSGTTNEVVIKFSSYMSDDAAKASSYTVTDGTTPLTVTRVAEQADNTYVLTLSGNTEVGKVYTLSFANLKDWYGKDLATTSIKFLSVEGKEYINDNFDKGSGTIGGWNVGTARVDSEDAAGNANSGAVKITLTDGDNAWARQLGLKDKSWAEIPAVTGKTYRISLKAKSEKAISLTPVADSGAAVYAAMRIPASDSWTYCETEFTATKDTSSIYFAVGGNVGDSFYIDDLKFVEVPDQSTDAAKLTSSTPTAGTVALPTSKVTLKFDGYMSDAAKDPKTYTVTGGTTPITVASVEEQTDNTYVLNLSGKTEIGRTYTVSFASLKDWRGNVVADSAVTFFSDAKVVRSSNFDKGTNEAGNKWSILQIGGSNDDYGVDKNVDCENNSDSYSMFFTLRGTNVAWYNYSNRINLKVTDSQSLSVEKDKNYVITMKVKSTNDVAFEPIVAEEIPYSSSRVTVTGDDTWKDCEIRLTAHKNGVLQLGTIGNDGQVFYIDNFALYTDPDPISDPFTFVSGGGACKTLDGITVQFSHELGAKGLDPESYTLTGGTQKVKEVKALGDKAYKLVFDKYLTANKNYTLSMNVADIYGRKLTKDISFNTPVKVLRQNGFSTSSAEHGGNKWDSLQWSAGEFGWDEADANGDSNSGSMKYTSGATKQAWYTNLLSVKVDSNSGLNVTAGKTYTFIMKVKSADAITVYPFIANNYKADSNDFLNGSPGKAYGSVTVGGTDEWQTCSITFTPVRSSGLTFGVDIDANKTFYVDDFVLVTDPETLTVEGTTNVNDSSVTLTFSNDMDEESVKNIDNYSVSDAEIDRIEKVDSKNFKIYFKALEINHEYTLNYTGLSDAYTQTISGSYTVNITPEAKLYFDATKLYLYYGAEGQHEISDGKLTEYADTITAEVSGIENYSGTDRKLTLFVAYYENGALVSADSDTVTAVNSDVTAKAETKTLSAGVTTSAKESNDTVRELRAYLWDGETLAPIGTTAVLADFQ